MQIGFDEIISPEIWSFKPFVRSFYISGHSWFLLHKHGVDDVEDVKVLSSVCATLQYVCARRHGMGGDVLKENGRDVRGPSMKAPLNCQL